MTARLTPESARPLWTWLRRATAANDPFIDGGSNYYQRASRRFAPIDDARVPVHTMLEAPEPAAVWGFDVGKDVWWAVADRRHRLVYYGEHCCSFGRAVIARYNGAEPPKTIPDRDLTGSVPLGAPRIGSSAKVVFALLGMPKLRVHARGSDRWTVYYSQPLWTSTDRADRAKEPSCTDDLTAVFEEDHLVAFQKWRGC